MTYEYLCGGCGHEWEAEQSISAKPLKKCPACGKNQARRQISGGTGFLLKGGGWYADLYGSPSPAKKPGDGDDSSDKSAQKSDAKSPEGDKGSKTDSSKKAPSKGSGNKKSKNAA